MKKSRWIVEGGLLLLVSAFVLSAVVRGEVGSREFRMIGLFLLGDGIRRIAQGKEKDFSPEFFTGIGELCGAMVFFVL